MGGGSSTQVSTLGKSQAAIVKLMMPLYYNAEDITPDERQLAYVCWHLILDDKTPEFLAKRGTAEVPYESCVTFFYDNFYLRLFDIHPMAKALFKSGMKSQGKFLVQMISLALSELDDKIKFDRNLVKLAEIHNQRGVKAVEYGVVGDVLFWVLKKVMGEAYYTPELHRCWVKIYSRMLRTIVPVAVAMELIDGTAQLSRLSTHEKMFHGNTPTSSQKMLSGSDSGSDLPSERIRVAETTKSTT